MRWEYKTAVMSHGFMGRKRGEMDRGMFERGLAEFGEQGYELAWVFMDQALQHEKDGHVLLFKRPLAGDGEGVAAVPAASLVGGALS